MYLTLQIHFVRLPTRRGVGDVGLFLHERRGLPLGVGTVRWAEDMSVPLERALDVGVADLGREKRHRLTRPLLRRVWPIHDGLEDADVLAIPVPKVDREKVGLVLRRIVPDGVGHPVECSL